MNTAFYIYGNIRLKEISTLNSFEQVQENTIAGSAFSARLGSSAVAFIPDRHGFYHLTGVHTNLRYSRYPCPGIHRGLCV